MTLVVSDRAPVVDVPAAVTSTVLLLAFGVTPTVGVAPGGGLSPCAMVLSLLLLLEVASQNAAAAPAPATTEPTTATVAMPRRDQRPARRPTRDITAGW